MRTSAVLCQILRAVGWISGNILLLSPATEETKSSKTVTSSEAVVQYVMTKTHILPKCVSVSRDFLFASGNNWTRGRGSSLFPCYSSICNHGVLCQIVSLLFCFLWELRTLYYLKDLLPWGTLHAVAQQATIIKWLQATRRHFLSAFPFLCSLNFKAHLFSVLL